MNQAIVPYYMPARTPADQRPNSLFAKGGLGTAFLTFAALCTSLFVYGFVGDLMGQAGEILRTTAIITTVGLAMIGAAICMWRGMILAAFLSIAGFASVFVSLFVFSINSGLPFTFGAGGQYIGLSFVGLFCLSLHDGTAGKLLRWYFILCCGYAVFFILALSAIRLGLIDVGAAIRGIASADDVGRGTRLHASAFPLIFGITYSAARFRLKPGLPYLILLAVFALTFWMTESRTITALTIAVVVGYLILRNAILIGKASFILYTAGAMLSVVILTDPTLNPFLYFSDSSAEIRANSINIASDFFGYYWLLGAGLSFGIDGYSPLTGIFYFFPGDIGLMGILFSYGVVGFVGYSLLVYFGCFSYRRVVAALGSNVIAEAITLTGSVIAMYSLLSPQYDGGSSGSILAMFLIALRLYRPARQKAPDRAAPRTPTQVWQSARPNAHPALSSGPGRAS